MKSFLVDVAARHDGQCLMLIGHAATLFTLEHLFHGRPLAETVGHWPERPWRYALAEAGTAGDCHGKLRARPQAANEQGPA